MQHELLNWTLIPAGDMFSAARPHEHWQLAAISLRATDTVTDPFLDLEALTPPFCSVRRRWLERASCVFGVYPTRVRVSSTAESLALPT